MSAIDNRMQKHDSHVVLAIYLGQSLDYVSGPMEIRFLVVFWDPF